MYSITDDKTVAADEKMSPKSFVANIEKKWQDGEDDDLLEVTNDAVKEEWEKAELHECVCFHCGGHPCVVDQCNDEFMEQATMLEESEAPPNDCRHSMCRFMSNLMYGPLGEGNCKRLEP